MGFIEGGTPVVLLDRRIHGLPVDIVVSDNHQADCQATKHLIQVGHRRIALITCEALIRLQGMVVTGDLGSQ